VVGVACRRDLSVGRGGGPAVANRAGIAAVLMNRPEITTTAVFLRVPIALSPLEPLVWGVEFASSSGGFARTGSCATEITNPLITAAVTFFEVAMSYPPSMRPPCGPLEMVWRLDSGPDLVLKLPYNFDLSLSGLYRGNRGKRDVSPLPALSADTVNEQLWRGEEEVRLRRKTFACCATCWSIAENW